jgi:hypothetical protein
LQTSQSIAEHKTGFSKQPVLCCAMLHMFQFLFSASSKFLHRRSCKFLHRQATATSGYVVRSSYEAACRHTSAGLSSNCLHVARAGCAVEVPRSADPTRLLRACRACRQHRPTQKRKYKEDSRTSVKSWTFTKVVSYRNDARAAPLAMHFENARNKTKKSLSSNLLTTIRCTEYD